MHTVDSHNNLKPPAPFAFDREQGEAARFLPVRAGNCGGVPFDRQRSTTLAAPAHNLAGVPRGAAPSGQSDSYPSRIIPLWEPPGRCTPCGATPAFNIPGVWPWTDHAEGQASLAGRSRHNTEPYAWQPCPRMAAQGLQPESTTQVIRRTTLLVSERPLQDGHQKGISCTAPRGEIRGGAVFCSPPDSESLKPQIRAGEGRYPHGQARLFIARWGGPSRRSTGTSTRRPCSRQQTRSRTRKPRPARDLSRAGLCRTTYPASASLNGVWT